MINKAFVINLDSKPEQFEEVKQAFQPYGIRCKRFSAIKNEVRQVGASLSFLTLIAQAKKEKAPWVMILEDDCIPRPEMDEWSAVSNYLVQNKKRWDVFLGGAAYVYPRVLRNDFKPKRGITLDVIECSHAVLSHFAVFNESSYDRLLKWYNLPLPLAKRPVIDAFIPVSCSRIWIPFPNMVWQKVHSGTDLTAVCVRAEQKLKYFSEQMRLSWRYRLFRRWLKTIA